MRITCLTFHANLLPLPKTNTRDAIIALYTLACVACLSRPRWRRINGGKGARPLYYRLLVVRLCSPILRWPLFLILPRRRRRIFVVVVFTLALWQQGLLHRFAEAANGRNYSRRLFKRTTWAGDDVKRKKKKKMKYRGRARALSTCALFCCLCLCCDRVGRVILVSIFFLSLFLFRRSRFLVTVHISANCWSCCDLAADDRRSEWDGVGAKDSDSASSCRLLLTSCSVMLLLLFCFCFAVSLFWLLCLYVPVNGAIRFGRTRCCY